MLKLNPRRICLVSVIIPLLATPSSGADLVQIRTGFYHSYSRIVLEFNSPVQYQILRDESAAIFILEARPVQSVRIAGGVRVDRGDKYLERVETVLSASVLRVKCALMEKDVKIETRELDWPFRVVLDIRPTSATGKVEPVTIEATLDLQSGASTSPGPGNSNADARQESDSAGSELLDIRTGFHDSYSRIVSEFSEPVDYNVSRDSSMGTIVLEFRPVAKSPQVQTVQAHHGDAFLERLQADWSSSVLRVTGFLKEANVELEIRRLVAPFRVVIDVRPTERATRADGTIDAVASGDSLATQAANDNGSESPQEPVTRPIAVADSPSVSEDSVDTQIALVDFRHDIFGQNSPHPQPENDQPEALVDQAAGTRNTGVLAKVILGFILFDVLLATGYVLVRRRRSPATGSSVAGSERKAQRADESMQRKEAFLEVLHESLAQNAKDAGKAVEAESEQTNLHAIAAAAKLDQMIDSLSNALSFDIDPLARELDTLAMRSGLTRTQIMGKDGQAFLGNLKRLQSN